MGLPWAQEEQQGVVDAVMGLLTSPGDMLLTKGMAVAVIMCQTSTLWLLMACEAGLPTMVWLHALLGACARPCLLDA